MDTTSQTYADARQFRDALAAGKAPTLGKGLRKGFTPKLVKAEQSAEGGAITATFILSTPAVDSYNDVIDQKGWNLTRYNGNPIVLWGHNSWSPPIGKCTKIWLDGDALMGTVEFTSKDVSEFGYMIGQMVKGGFLSAVSVGFYPDEYTFDQKRGGVNFIKQTLLEFSVVSIPANPEALLVPDEEMKSLEDSLQTFKAAGGDVTPLVACAAHLHSQGVQVEASTLKAFDGMVQRVAKAAPELKAGEGRVSFVVTVPAGKAAADFAILMRGQGLAYTAKDDGDGTGDDTGGDDLESATAAMTECLKDFKATLKSFSAQTDTHQGCVSDLATHVATLGKHITAMADNEPVAGDDTSKDAAAPVTKGGAPHKLSKKNAADLAIAKSAIAAIDARHSGAADAADPSDDEPAAEPAPAPAADDASKAASAPVVKAPTAEEIAKAATAEERNALVAKLAATVKQKGDLITKLTGKVAPVRVPAK